MLRYTPGRRSLLNGVVRERDSGVDLLRRVAEVLAGLPPDRPKAHGGPVDRLLIGHGRQRVMPAREKGASSLLRKASRSDMVAGNQLLTNLTSKGPW